MPTYLVDLGLIPSESQVTRKNAYCWKDLLVIQNVRFFSLLVQLQITANDLKVFVYNVEVSVMNSKLE